jgi:hypothetical protein
MKFSYLLFIFLLPVNSVIAQEKKEFTNTVTFESYVDFLKQGTQSAFWVTYDHKKISLEARYGYDWEKNGSIYAGPFLKCRDWKIRLLQGLTFGKATGFSFSPTTILDAKKIYIFNQPQYIIGISGMPSNFSHWGEFYYKIIDAVWFGVTDRYYIDKTGHDFAFGPQLLITYKNLFITFYWWIPSKQTESRAFLEAGYEHEL